MELDVESFDVPSALDNALTLVRERAQRHGIALGLDVDPGLASCAPTNASSSRSCSTC